MNGALTEQAFGERDALGELLIAALNLCMQTQEFAAADHVLEALRTLPSGEESDGEPRVGFE